MTIRLHLQSICDEWILPLLLHSLHIKVLTDKNMFTVYVYITNKSLDGPGIFYYLIKRSDILSYAIPPLQMALQPGVGLGLLCNMPPGLSVPCSVSPFVYTHLSQVHGHVIQPSHSWSSSSSRCMQLSVQHLFCDFGVLHFFYMAKPSYSLAFNKPDNVLSLDYGL